MKVSAVPYSAYPGKNVANLLSSARTSLACVRALVDRVHPSEENAEFVEFDMGNNQWFTLMPERFAGQQAVTGAGIVFEVDDIDAILDEVRKHAKSADEKTPDYPNCRTAASDKG